MFVHTFTRRVYSKTDLIEIYNLLLTIAEIADFENDSVYCQDAGSVRKELEAIYNIRLVMFRDTSSDGFITDLSHEDQVLFVLFAAQMCLTGDIPE